jgi:two-component system, OmpR family, alkaline phosphatase synthesis response regulator PhoP
MAKQIILCDDEIAILRAAEYKLTAAGFDVRCAGNGEEAWREIERRLPDLVVTDLQMPRLDGFGLCRRIRENPLTRHLPVIMLTAKGFELSAAESTEKYRLAKLMIKPFSPRELLRNVEQILNGLSSDVGCPLPAPDAPMRADLGELTRDNNHAAPR